MTKEEILEYRSSGIPDDVLVFMDQIAKLAQTLDTQPPEPYFSTVKLTLYNLLISAENRVSHYYLKRQKDFGIHNLRLKRLLDSFPEIFQSFGFPRNPPI